MDHHVSESGLFLEVGLENTPHVARITVSDEGSLCLGEFFQGSKMKKREAKKREKREQKRG